MDRKPIEKMSRYEILNALAEDGFDISPLEAAEVSLTIQQAARAGALIWSENRITSTLNNHPLTLWSGRR